MRTKTRLTITLSEDVVGQLDGMIDQKTIKNRSHAIETILKTSLTPAVRTAVILAGGSPSGTAGQNPALTKFGSTTLLASTLNLLKKHHVTRVIIALPASDQKIKKLVGNGEAFGLTVEYSREEKPLGTGGAVKKLRPLLENAPFLVIHADVLTTLNLSNLFAFHFAQNTLATIAVKPRMSEPKYGQAFLQGNQIVRFLDQGATDGISIINTGVSVFDPAVFSVFPNRARFTLEKDVYPQLAAQQQLSAWIFQGSWYDITHEASLKEATRRWLEITGTKE